MLYNLGEYHRPSDLNEALGLIQRKDIRTLPLAGGTAIGSGRDQGTIEAIVDLDALGLDFIERTGNLIRMGAMTRLQTLVDGLADAADGLLAHTAHRMAGPHIRNAATLGGTLASGQVHSPLSVALAALRAELEVTGHDHSLAWPVPLTALEGQLILSVRITLPEGGMAAACEQVARTPADAPIVCAASVISAGRAARTAVGGLVAGTIYLYDQPVGPGVPAYDPTCAIAEQALRSTAIDDYLGSADYRRSVAAVLARRTLAAALERLV